jgi:hypothetical protein
VTDLQIKAAVRARDGHRCTECGMTAAEHRQRYGRTLDVHRLEPGKPYTIDGCLTLCRKCHGPKPRSRYGSSNRMTLWLEADVVAAVKLVGWVNHQKPSDVINDLIDRHLAHEISEAASYMNPKGQDRGRKKP